MPPVLRLLACVVLLLAPAGPAPAQDLPSPPRRDDGLPVASPAAAGLALEPLAAMTRALEAGEFQRTTSVLIVSRGRLAYERYFGEGGPEVLNDTRSAMKSVTSLAVGAALADGLLASVDEPAFERLEDLAPFAHAGALKSGITLADLLTMSSALDCDDEDPGSPGNEENMYPLRAWTRWAVDLPVKSGYRRDTSGRGPFAYCTAGTLLLGQILERAAGERVDRYVERRLLAPLGIGRTEWPRSPRGEIMTGGGLRLRSRDLAKLGLLLLRQGKWRGRPVLPSSWIARALSAHRRVDAEQDYGYLFWRRDYATPGGPLSGWYMSGNGGNAIVSFADRDAAVVVTARNYNTRGMHQRTRRLIEEYVLRALLPAGVTSEPRDHSTLRGRLTSRPGRSRHGGRRVGDCRMGPRLRNSGALDLRGPVERSPPACEPSRFDR